MYTRPFIKLTVAYLMVFGLSISLHASQEANTVSPKPLPNAELILGSATVSEKVKNRIPYNSAVAFSISLDKLYCFTDFVSVPEQTIIYHNWYHRDKKRASVKLLLKPTRWATFSHLNFRKDDKGPWRVEVTDQKGGILHILRFSIID
jgi:hypothetical protein